MIPEVTGSTRLFAVLGRPVSHSLSPAMHGAAFAARGIDAVYVALSCSDHDLEGLMRGLVGAGGGGNITLPHKRQAAAVIERALPDAERTGTCNTFWEEGGRLIGDNTDVVGVRAAAAALLEGPLQGLNVLLLGAGGAARAALTALVDEEVSEVVVMNRTPARAHSLVDRLGRERARVVEGVDDLEGASFDLVVQATRLGLAANDPLPLDLGRLGKVGAVLDLAYGFDDTPFVRDARARSIPAQDGREMLVQQGAAAFRRWFGDPVPLLAMRTAVAAARRL